MVNQSLDDYFPYDSYRDNQKDGMKRVSSTLDDNGYSLVEAACGTGKTLLSLTPSIKKIRNDSNDFNKIFIVTSVKQQQEVIEDEIENINKSLDDKIKSVTIKGKADVCTYVDEGKIKRKDIYTKCEELRNTTRDFGEESYSDLIISSKTDNSKYPYSTDNIPSKDQKQYCPFYAGFLERKGREELENFPKKFNDIGHINTRELVNTSSSKGMCPHSVMTELIGECEIIIGNLNHLFDQKTVEKLTSSIIDENTILIVDEGHNIIPRSRDLLSNSLNMAEIQDCLNEIRGVISLIDNIENNSNNSIPFKVESKEELKKLENKMESLLKLSDNPKDTLEKFENIISDLKDKIESKIDNHNLQYGNDKIQLRDPEKIERDGLELWLEDKNLKEIKGLNTMSQLITCCYSNLDNYDTIPSISTLEVYNFLEKWIDVYNSQYYKYIKVEENKKSGYSLELFNCIPTEKIKSRLSEFGGGVIMSATLEPLDVYKKTVGLNELDSRTEEIKYGLSFPLENRKSLCVNLPKFKSKNKKKARDSKNKPNLNNVRLKYAESIRDVINNNQGNILVAMPSYKEAWWASSVLKQETDVPNDSILVDQSSSNKATSNIKKQFFEMEEKRILITGARGTLTEGIDYKDDKLNCVIVCGVPIRNIASDKSKAIRKSYETKFGSNNGFEYSFVIPAVRKARQSIGRLIRTQKDRGVRILMDQRYCCDDWDSVQKYLSKQEREEFKEIDKTELVEELDSFWDD
jgi:DNA excision repair protein ERCC-2